MRKEFAEEYFKIVSFLNPEHDCSLDYFSVKVSIGHTSNRYYVPERKVLDVRILESHLNIKTRIRQFISDIVGRNVTGTHPELTLNEIKILSATIVDKDFKYIPDPAPNFMINGNSFVGLCGGCVINLTHPNKQEEINIPLLIRKLKSYMLEQRKCTAVVVPKDEASYGAVKNVAEELNEKGREAFITEVFETKSFIYTI